MLKKFDIKIAIILFFIFYSFFFIVGGISAPVFAHFKLFSQADSIYLLFHKSCHQDALRCFWIFGYQMAICARCFGAYVGVALFLISHLLNFRSNKFILWMVAFFAFGEILLEMMNILESNNYARLFAGICLGIFFAIVLTKFLYNKNKLNDERVCGV